MELRRSVSRTRNTLSFCKSSISGDAPSLYNEENFRAFIDQWEINGYDKFSPYFRWTVSFTRKQLEAVINKNLSNLQKSQPAFILTKGSDGAFISKEIPEDIGELQNIEVVRRGEGGNIMELEISTTHGIFKIIKELNIRRLLQPTNLILEKSQFSSNAMMAQSKGYFSSPQCICIY